MTEPKRLANPLIPLDPFNYTVVESHIQRRRL
jgi:hypothetical protein